MWGVLCVKKKIVLIYKECYVRVKSSVVQVTSKLWYIIDYLLLLFKSNLLPYNISLKIVMHYITPVLLLSYFDQNNYRSRS